MCVGVVPKVCTLSCGLLLTTKNAYLRVEGLSGHGKILINENHTSGLVDGEDTSQMKEKRPKRSKIIIIKIFVG